LGFSNVTSVDIMGKDKQEIMAIETVINWLEWQDKPNYKL
jgi:hypothetical protein